MVFGLVFTAFREWHISSIKEKLRKLQDSLLPGHELEARNRLLLSKLDRVKDDP
jgi:hypothetical protein